MCVFKHSPTTPVLRILGGAETGRYLWLPESQPHYQLSNKPCHKGINQGVKQQNTLHPSLASELTCTVLYADTHKYDQNIQEVTLHSLYANAMLFQARDLRLYIIGFQKQTPQIQRIDKSSYSAKETSVKCVPFTWMVRPPLPPKSGSLHLYQPEDP